MDVDLNAVLAEVSEQRNAALNENAKLRAAIGSLQAELAELKETETSDG